MVKCLVCGKEFENGFGPEICPACLDDKEPESNINNKSIMVTRFVITAVMDSDDEFIKDMIPVFGKCSKTRCPGQPSNIPFIMCNLHYSIDGEYTQEQLISMIPENLRRKYGINKFVLLLDEVTPINK